jgi:tetratricopeptide (TPR) repeat protein
MSEQLIDIQAAENDLLACATFLAEKIGSSDGYAEAMKEIIPYYLAKNEVDTAASLADSIEDPFVRDQLLVTVAEKCAEIDDDEYALQLADAIEDQSFQGVCLEGIARQKALKNQFEKAFKIADDLEHASNAYAEIAIRQKKEDALQTIEKIEFPYTKVHVLQEIANNSNDIALLEKATEIAKEIEFEEEIIRAYLNIAFQYIEAKRNDKAIEVLDKARQFAETHDSVQKDSFLSSISQGFMKAGSVDLADRTLDLVEDKYEIANALVGYADAYWGGKEEADALEALDEAHEILKSQRENETRNSKAKYNLFGLIAIRFAEYGQLERAIEIANENPYEETRHNSLAQIAVICETKGNDDLAHQAIKDITDEAEKTLAMISLSDVRRKNEQSEEALKLLNEAYFHIGTVQQLSMKSLTLNRLAERFSLLENSERAREICSENLRVISNILDESHRATALAGLAQTFESLKFELNAAEKDVLRTMIRKTVW